jgi:hypothetical protein
MRTKISLKVNDLNVESFEVLPPELQLTGTIQGNEAEAAFATPNQSCGGTCGISCETRACGTCYDSCHATQCAVTCTCGDTCPNTCADSCPPCEIGLVTSNCL